MIVLGTTEASMDLNLITATMVEIREWIRVTMEVKTIPIVSIKNQPMMSIKLPNSNFWLMKSQTRDMIKKLSVTT